MVLYFSGTGNSAYVANEIGKSLSDNVLNLHQKIADSDFSPLHSETAWVIMTPVYAWRIPRIVSDWLLRTKLTGNLQVYFVIICGECVKVCPLNNIQLIDGKPAWGKNCTHCMACINYCPTAAIEYGKQTKDKPRYHI